MITSHSAALSSQQCPQKVEDAKDKEETEESLGVATEIDTIIFLVMLVDLLALVGKHSIDFLQLALYLNSICLLCSSNICSIFCQSASLTFTDTFNAGRVVTNILLSVISIIVEKYTDMGVVGSSFFTLMAFVGIVMALLNGKPMNMGAGINNDGRNILMLSRSARNRRLFIRSFQIR